jgi:hypothetical protein
MQLNTVEICTIFKKNSHPHIKHQLNHIQKKNQESLKNQDRAKSPRESLKNQDRAKSPRENLESPEKARSLRESQDVSPENQREILENQKENKINIY